MPSFRLIAKEKQADGRCRKVYEKEPRTPYERLMESPDVSEECKAELLRRRAGYNPVAMNPEAERGGWADLENKPGKKVW
jgi:hypothetical protein